MPRKYPNIIVTGTPGVGKSTTAQQLIELAQSDTNEPRLPLQYLSVNKIAKDQDLYETYDEELKTHVIDEDKLLDHITSVISDGSGQGGFVIDHHDCALFPERWVDLVVVLRCEDTSVFYERLTSDKKAEDGQSRGYTGKKLDENIDAEIFGVIAEEARDAWPSEGAVVELQSVEVEQIEENAERILEWCRMWMKDHTLENGEDG